MSRVYAGERRRPRDASAGQAGEPSPGVPDAVVVGSASRDLTTEDPRGWRLGGGASYCGLALARLGVKVGVLVGVDEQAAGAWELGLLAAAGADVRPVRLGRGPVFENIERDGLRRQRWLSASDPVPPAALPEEWRSAGVWLLVPVAAEVPDQWAAVARPGARIVVGWQGLLRRFAPEGWVERTEPRPSPLLAAADLVCASVNDLPRLDDLDLLRSLAPRADLVLTHGAAGGWFVRRDGRSGTYPAIPAGPPVDPTGAGDVFLAGLVAAWLATGEALGGRSLRAAAAAGSLAVEGTGLAGAPDLAALAERLGRPPGRARVTTEAPFEP